MQKEKKLLRIRFTRVGKKGKAQYRIVLADSRKPVKGKFIKILGNYNPHTKELNYNEKELLDLMAKGAQPSNAIAVLLKKQKVKLPQWVKIKEKHKKPKVKEKKEKPAPKAEGVPAEEVKPEVPAEAVEASQGIMPESEAIAVPEEETASKDQNKEVSEQ